MVCPGLCAGRSICFSPTDTKFCSGSDDATVKVHDFSKGTEAVMAGARGGAGGVRCGAELKAAAGVVHAMLCVP